MNKAKVASLNRGLMSLSDPSKRENKSSDIIPNVSEKFKKKRGCGCQSRKEWMNKKIPGSGDLIEKVTTATGIKGLVDFYFTESELDTNGIH